MDLVIVNLTINVSSVAALYTNIFNLNFTAHLTTHRYLNLADRPVYGVQPWFFAFIILWPAAQVLKG